MNYVFKVANAADDTVLKENTKENYDRADELEVYKKAYDLACEEIKRKTMCSWCDLKCKECRFYPNECVNHVQAIKDRLLVEAKEDQEDNNEP